MLSCVLRRRGAAGAGDELGSDREHSGAIENLFWNQPLRTISTMAI